MTPNHRPEKRALRAARGVISLAPMCWGLALLGVARWLLKGQDPGAALPCVVFSAGYFWFAWSFFSDPAWESGAGAREREDPPVVEPRATLDPRELGKGSSSFEQIPSTRAWPRSSRDAA